MADSSEPVRGETEHCEHEWAIRVEDNHYFVYSLKTDECIAMFDGRDPKAETWANRTCNRANTIAPQAG